jgi:hypothetical protein
VTEPGRPDEPGPGAGPRQPAEPGYWDPATPPYAYPPPQPFPAPGYLGQQPVPWWYDPGDPLVNPPGAGLSGWFARAVDVVRRSWRILLLIALITQFAPTVVLSIVGLGLLSTLSLPTVPATPDDPPPELPPGSGADLALFVGVVLVGLVISILLQTVGWAAGAWAVTRQAGGQRAPLGAALAYGLRRAPGLVLWTLLSGLIVMVGIVLCILPGIYFAFALSLVGPVFLFERRNPIGRSFSLFHARPWMLLGRETLLAAVLIVGWFATTIVGQLALLPTDSVRFGSVDVSVGSMLAYPVYAAVQVAVGVLVLAGLLVTYAEQRAQEPRRITTSTLLAELG